MIVIDQIYNMSCPANSSIFYFTASNTPCLIKNVSLLFFE